MSLSVIPLRPVFTTTLTSKIILIPLKTITEHHPNVTGLRILHSSACHYSKNYCVGFMAFCGGYYSISLFECASRHERRVITAGYYGGDWPPLRQAVRWSQSAACRSNCADCIGSLEWRWRGWADADSDPDTPHWRATLLTVSSPQHYYIQTIASILFPATTDASFFFSFTNWLFCGAFESCSYLYATWDQCSGGCRGCIYIYVCVYSYKI